MKKLSLFLSLCLICLIIGSISFARELIFFVPSSKIFASNLAEAISFNETINKSKITKYPNQITIDLQNEKIVGITCRFDLADFSLIENQIDSKCEGCKVNLDKNVDVRVWKDTQNGTLLQLQKTDSTLLILLSIAGK